MVGPAGSFSTACRKIRTDCRISWIRTMYRSKVSPFSPVGTSKST